MTTLARQEPIRFARGRRLYLIARAYTGEDGFIGIIGGRIVARGTQAAAVARALIEAK